MELDIKTSLVLDEADIEDRIIAAAAAQVFNSYHVKYELASSAIERAIAAKAEKAVDELFARGVQPVDSYGNPKGDARPVADMFIESINTYMAVAVNDRGEPSRDSYGTKMSRAEYLVRGEPSRDSYGTKMSRAEYLVRKVATDKLVALATAEMKRLNEEAQKAIRDTVATAIAAQMQKMAGGKS